MICPKCGQKIDNDSKFCTRCGSPIVNAKTDKNAKNKMPVLKRWWFWVIVIILLFGMIGSCGENSTEDSTQPTAPSTSETTATEATTEPATEATIEPATTETSTEPVTTAAVTEPETSAATSPVETTVESEPAPEIDFISYPETISRGNTGTVKIKGTPNTEYNITVEYKSGPSNASGLETKTSDANGYVSWRWKVGINTSPGMFSITVRGGGKSETVHFTVTE